MNLPPSYTTLWGTILAADHPEFNWLREGGRNAPRRHRWQRRSVSSLGVGIYVVEVWRKWVRFINWLAGES